MTTTVGPCPCHSFGRSPPRCPGLVTKSIVSTNERVDCGMMMKIFLALIAISHAPPEPGSRTFGFA